MSIEATKEPATRIRVYDIPSFSVLKQFDVPDGGREHPWGNTLGGDVKFIPGSDVVAVIRWGNPATLELYDLDTGRLLSEHSLGPTDYRGSWDLFVDAAGHYVGVNGDQWVQLFAVRPQG